MKWCGAGLRPASSADLPVRAPQPLPSLQSLEARVRSLETKLNLMLRERDLEDQILDLEIRQAFMPALSIIARAFHATPARLLRKGRSCADARQVAMVTLKRLFPCVSLQTIADLMGLTDHASVLWAQTAVRNKRDTDPVFRARLESIEAKLFPPDSPTDH